MLKIEKSLINKLLVELVMIIVLLLLEMLQDKVKIILLMMTTIAIWTVIAI